MKNQHAKTTMVSFLLAIFFLKIRFIQGTQYHKTHLDRGEAQMLRDQEIKLDTVNPLSDISIIYNGNQLVNNSVIRVPEGETVTLTCEETKKENNQKPSSSQINSHQVSSTRNDKSSVQGDSVYGWYSDGVIISNTQTLTLPNAYLDTLPSHLTCAIHGPSSSAPYGTEEDKNKKRKPNTGNYFQNDISISKNNIRKHANVELAILSPPSFTIRRIPAFGIPIVEGMTVVLSCDIEIEQSSSSAFSDTDNEIIPKWMKNEIPVDIDDVGGSLRQVKGAVTIMSMSMSDVGWYQCYTDLDGETYSSIGYFLNVKPSDEFHDEVDSNADSIGDTEDDEAYEGGEKSDSGYENKINDGRSSDLTSTTSTERNNFQMVGNNVVYEEGSERKVSRGTLQGNFLSTTYSLLQSDWINQ